MVPAAQSLQSCPTLQPQGLPGSSVHGILQARILERVAMPSSRGSAWPRDRTCISCIAGRFFTAELLGMPTIYAWKMKVKVKVAKLCLTLCNPMDYTVHGILQARILKWIAFPFGRGSSQARDRTQVSCIAGGFFTSWATRESLKQCKLPLFSTSCG